MNPLVFHIASGHSFFTGIALIIAGVAVSARAESRSSRAVTLLLAMGAILIAISSTPIPYWLYALCAAATVGWLIGRRNSKWQRPVSWICVVAWLAAGAVELPYHIGPSLRTAGSRSMTVIGDSVTAGIGGDETAETWPALLERSHDVSVQDISHIGETARSALRRAQDHTINGSVVLVEIGGNDLLGGTSAAQFAVDLEALLQHLASADRQIVMFELPLPPFCNEWGRIQRDLARRYGVLLVPKRVFLSVIGGSDSTLDTIHLTQAGHERMAEIAWEIVEQAYPPLGGS